MLYEAIQRFWLTGFIALAAVMYFFAFAGWKVQEDARKLGLGRAAVTFWSVSVVFFGLIFLPLYLVFRSRAVFAGKPKEERKDGRYKLCPHCGEENPFSEKVCKTCRRLLDSMESALGTKMCPYCGAENPIESQRCRKCDQMIGFAGTDEG